MNKTELRKTIAKLLFVSVFVSAIQLSIFCNTYAAVLKPTNMRVFCSIIPEGQGMIPGNVALKGYEGFIEIKNFSFEPTSSISGIENISQTSPDILTISKEIDKSSAKLAYAYMSQETLKEVTLDLMYQDSITAGSASPTNYLGYSIKLENAKIIKRDISYEHINGSSNGHTTGSVTFVENISFSYKSINEFNKISNLDAPLTSVGSVCKINWSNAGMEKEPALGGQTGAFILDNFDILKAPGVENDNSDPNIIKMLKYLDKSSKKLADAYKAGNKIPELILYYNDPVPIAAGSKGFSYTITLTNVVVTNRRLYRDPAERIVYEELSLSFEGIDETD